MGKAFIAATIVFTLSSQSFADVPGCDTAIAQAINTAAVNAVEEGYQLKAHQPPKTMREASCLGSILDVNFGSIFTSVPTLSEMLTEAIRMGCEKASGVIDNAVTSVDLVAPSFQFGTISGGASLTGAGINRGAGTVTGPVIATPDERPNRGTS